MEQAGGSSWRATVRQVIAVVSASLVALVSGTPNAFNAVSDDVRIATHSSPLFISTLTGIGVAGLFISLPAGLLADAYGTAAATAAGGIAVVGGYIGMSYSGDLPPLLVLCYALVGLGSGCTFLASLSTAINTTKAWAVALVSLCMSLSISFTVSLLEFYESHFECTEPSCWAGYIRMLAIVCAVFIGLGALGIHLTLDPVEDVPVKRERMLSLDVEMSCCQSTRVLQRRDFWLVFIANVAGIGGGVFIVSSVQQVWANFATPNLLHWGRHIIVMFSVCTAIANVISPMAADYLHQRGKLQRAHFAGFILAFVCTNYVVLGLCTALPSIRNGGGTAVAVLYMCLMALVGVGFGSSLTLFPTLLSEVYGLKNFGTNLSYLQLGSAIISIAVPAITTTVYNETHVYSPMVFLLAGLALIGSVCCFLGRFRTFTFGVTPHGQEDTPLQYSVDSKRDGDERSALLDQPSHLQGGAVDSTMSHP